MRYNHLVMVAVLAIGSASVSAAPPRFPLSSKPVLPDGLGVNIHFRNPPPGEMEMLAAGGFRWVRMDFTWSATEREIGKYDFSAYDQLMAALEPHGIRALFILDYANKLYDDGLSPHTERGRQAFANWAVAAARHFRGRGIVWEMYNEPNIGFWKPTPKVDDYIKLARAVGQALRQATPQESYIGPATSRIDWEFLEACFRAGLLEYWDAVSVHPYRQQPPETVAAEYARLRHLIDMYAPAGKRIPLVSGEWGYSSAWNAMDPVKQSRMLPRQWLTNIAHGVPLSIWYDWHDDGRDPKEPEHHFGTVQHPFHAGRDPVYDTKPAYLAAQTLTRQLAGCRFSKRLDVGQDDVHVYLFRSPAGAQLVGWTSGDKPRTVTLPCRAGRFSAVGYTGDKQPPLQATDAGLTLKLTAEPLYVVPDSENAWLDAAIAIDAVPLELYVAADKPVRWTIRVQNPFDERIRMRLDDGQWQSVARGKHVTLVKKVAVRRIDQRRRITTAVTIDKIGQVRQVTYVSACNPLHVVAQPVVGNKLVVKLSNPSGDAFRGNLIVTDMQGIAVDRARVPITIAAGQTEIELELPCRVINDKYGFGVRLEDSSGGTQARMPVRKYVVWQPWNRLAASKLEDVVRVIPDGDATVESDQSLRQAEPVEGPVSVDVPAVELKYRFAAGWKFVRIVPVRNRDRQISGKPVALGLWLYGDESGNQFRLRVADSTGQTLQPGGPRIDWRGWRYVELPLDGRNAGHWGGANDGKVHYPISWDSLGLVDSGQREACAGTLYMTMPTLIYETAGQ